MDNTLQGATNMDYTHIVTLRFQYPAWDEKVGIQFFVTATSKSDAIARARRQAYDDGHLCGGKGRATFTAVKA